MHEPQPYDATVGIEINQAYMYNVVRGTCQVRLRPPLSLLSHLRAPLEGMMSYNNKVHCFIILKVPSTQLDHYISGSVD